MSTLLTRTPEQVALYLGVSAQTVYNWGTRHTAPPPFVQLAFAGIDRIRPAYLDGAAVRDWRHAHQLTQVELVEMLGVSASTVYSWERERTTPPAMLPLVLLELDLRLRERPVDPMAGFALAPDEAEITD